MLTSQRPVLDSLSLDKYQIKHCRRCYEACWYRDGRWVTVGIIAHIPHARDCPHVFYKDEDVPEAIEELLEIVEQFSVL